ncbi:hypothetical protein LR48_Vigan66s001000 [Vigna angularis]|uniref:DUF3082 domain-containing protein n=2 Tax=Phaseolus angularis TaxID=3914 RepID=A0A0L9T3V1_PHAAN|nr:uncharacterized protein LOC108318890 isoform X1 [Vigna angularis]KOM25257.1 hypothetical protein LR48_Vigan66s001000 [Vigna angularis]BAT98073.1 hypothetical protein VIGAN_09168800 [Vigna angularis var. angularis]
MLHSQCHHFLFPLSLSSTLTHHKPPHSLLPPIHHKRTILHSVSVSALPPWLAQLADAADVNTEGPIELPLSSTPSIFATDDEPSPIQVASSILLTGAISVFLFRALRRRAQRVKQAQFRSSGVKSLKEEALDSLKALGSASVDAKGPPSPVQTLLGGVSAGVIALILYKFASTIEGTLNRQTISDNYSVRQITITVRTIVNGLTYLATFVFGLNSLGLFLYSGQLAIKSIMGGDSTEKETESKSTEQSNSSKLSVENPTDNTELSGRKEEQSSNDAQ